MTGDAMDADSRVCVYITAVCRNYAIQEGERRGRKEGVLMEKVV